MSLDLEVGFIFFDGLVTVPELFENIKFIDEMALYETPSRLFGSLRIQSCTPYNKIAKKNNLVGEYDPGTMTSRCLFQHKDIQEIEDSFNLWEGATKQLIKLLPKEVRPAVYKGDFYFMKDLIISAQEGLDSLCEVLVRHASKRKILLSDFTRIFRRGDLLEEYLINAIRSNECLLR